jgi:chemotaxis protein CheD
MDKNKNIISINIGDYFVSSTPTIISTVLGPCVAVCLYDPQLKIGGMNHILLPGEADLKRYNKPARYALNSMELLINEMMKFGANRFKLTAKVFGGAHVISAISADNAVGIRNVEFIIDYLNNESIRITGYNIGGCSSRKINFHTDSGDVYMKRLKSNPSDTNKGYNDLTIKRIEKLLSKHESITYF